VLYGIERGAIEFFRGDPGRTLLFHDSVSLMQLVSIGLILTGAVLWWRGIDRAGPMRPVTQTPLAAGR
jgi:prolipoprotein diacylglyceryltransferase